MPSIRKTTTFRLPIDLLAQVDVECEARGQTRTMFVVRALEKALDGGVASESRSAIREGGAKDSSLTAAAPRSAPSRPSAEMTVGLGGPVKSVVVEDGHRSHHPKCACYMCKPPKS